MLKSLLLLSASLLPAQEAAPSAQSASDPPDFAAAARQGAYRYESLLWRMVPTTAGGRRSGPCDERVGRFCFWYSSPDEPPSPPPPPEPPEVANARTVAVRAHRQWFAADPSHPEAAGFLVRYLVESGRAREGVAAARTHAWAAERDPQSLMLVGLALHHAGDFAAAEVVFDSARTAAAPDLRREWDDVEVLLESGERRRYDDLSDAAREAYHRRLWAFADPLLLQPGNERRSAHYARHAWSTIFADAPRVRGKLSWGPDHEEILLRYGRPTGRKRIRDYGPASWTLSADPGFVESFGEEAATLVPSALVTRGLPELPPPGVRHEMERDTAPSAYAPVATRLRPIDVQVSRFPDTGGLVLRVDGVLPADTLEPFGPHAPQGLLAVLDTLGRELARSPATIEVRDDASTILSAEVPVPPGTYAYRVELLDDSTGIAGLTQYRLELDQQQGLRLSDLVAAHPFGDSLPDGRTHDGFRPFPAPLVPRGEVGFYAEVRGLAREADAARYQVEWTVESAESGSLLGRAARWLGERIGVVEAESPLAIRWEDVSSSGMAPVAVTIDLGGAEPGLYRVALTLTDRVTGESRQAERLLRVRETRATGPGPVPR